MKHLATALVLLLFHDAVICASPLRGLRGTDSISVNAWSLAVVAEMNSSRDSLGLLGVAPDATVNYDPAYDVPHPPNPPGDYVDFYFPHSGGTWPVFLGNQYATDITSPDSPRWMAVAGASFSSGTMSLTWDTTGIAQLPAGYTIMMKDSSTAAVISMRQQGSYTCSYSGARIFVFWVEHPSTIFTVQPRWNLVSVPVITQDSLKLHLFPTAISAAYSYNGSYQTDAVLKYGKGYWIKFGSADVVAISGTALPSVEIPLIAGWNLIGSVDHEIPAPSGGTLTSSCFGYNGAYTVDTTLKPGRAYWVKSSGAALLTLGGASAEGKVSAGSRPPREAARLTFSDPTGAKQILYLASDRTGEISSALYELPPVPPEAGFDVRFARQTYVESLGEPLDAAREFVIEVHASRFPLMISPDGLDPAKSVTLTEFAGEHALYVHAVSERESITLREPGVTRLLLTIRPAKTIQSEFTLRQNYPNPFNPATIIRYTVPAGQDGNFHVSLRVYNMLGQIVATLVDEIQGPGDKSVSWDATQVPSGVYYYSLTAGAFSQTRKMIVVK